MACGERVLVVRSVVSLGDFAGPGWEAWKP